MWRMNRAESGEGDVVFTLSGRVDAENVAELNTLVSAEGKFLRKVLDLKDLTLVDQAAISFLEGCEDGGLEFENCPAFIREWIETERRERAGKSVERPSGRPSQAPEL
jgi:hypothetical protein